VCLVLLKKTDLFKTVIPTKMPEFMACARPVILGVDGQARQMLEEEQSRPGQTLSHVQKEEQIAQGIQMLIATCFSRL
jgi:hypothetical protein